MIFRDALAVEEACLALVTGACVNFHVGREWNGGWPRGEKQAMRLAEGCEERAKKLRSFRGDDRSGRARRVRRRQRVAARNEGVGGGRQARKTGATGPALIERQYRALAGRLANFFEAQTDQNRLGALFHVYPIYEHIHCKCDIYFSK